MEGAYSKNGLSTNVARTLESSPYPAIANTSLRTTPCNFYSSVLLYNDTVFINVGRCIYLMINNPSTIISYRRKEHDHQSEIPLQ